MRPLETLSASKGKPPAFRGTSNEADVSGEVDTPNNTDAPGEVDTPNKASAPNNADTLVNLKDDRPRRPGIPPLLLAACAMWAGEAGSYLAFFEVPGHAFAVSVAALTLGLACALASLCKKVRTVFLIVSFAALGIAAGAAGAHAYFEASENLPTGKDEYVFTLTSDVQSSEYGSYAQASASSGSGFSGRVRIYFPSEVDLYNGARIASTCALSPVKDAQRETCYTSGILATASITDYRDLGAGFLRQTVYDLRAKAIELIGEYGGSAGEILAALVLGYRGPISESGTYDLFKQCGLAHVVAVSGAHLAIVTMTFGFILKACHARRWLMSASSILFVLAYLAFAGVPISAVRAAAMVVLSMTASFAGRRSASLNALALCIIAFIALDTSCAVSVSLFLSAGSTLGIICFASLISSYFAGLPKPVFTVIGEPLGLTLASNLATLPFSMALFNQLPLVAPLANIVATPLFTLACVFGLATTLLSCAFPALAPWLIGAGAWACMPLGVAVGALSSIPYGCLAVSVPVVAMIALSLVLMVVLWVFWPQFRHLHLACISGALALAGVLVIFVSATTHGDEVVMLDVGQGDAILVRSERRAVLIDTGNSDTKLRVALADQGIIHLDAVLITHPDSDHCASLASLFGYVEVDTFLCAKDMLECTCEKCTSLIQVAQAGVGEGSVVGLSLGDTVSLGKFQMEVVWPQAYTDQGGNADSLCLKAGLDCDQDGEIDWTCLLTGDAESDQLDEMIDLHLLGDLDVLKVGHHGSKVALDVEATSVLDPEIALISVGENNRYGHPSDEVLSLLGDAGAAIFRTDEEGSVTVRFDKGSAQVSSDLNSLTLEHGREAEEMQVE